MKNAHFYSHLPANTCSVNELLIKESAFHHIPDNWFVIITDIKGSTAAVNNGFSQLVNVIATGSIIAALNIAKEVAIDIPFFFGGDGATLLVPEHLHSKTMDALTKHQQNVKKEFSLDLRVGSLAVREVYGEGCELKIAKVKLNTLFSIPIVLGSGLQYAEKIIKSIEITPRQLKKETTVLNLEGMECRWDKILPPEDTKEIVCLIINAIKENQQAIVFKKILDEIDAIYGLLQKRHPISLAKLKLDAGLKKIKIELRLKEPSFSFLEWIKNWIFVLGGKYWYLPGKEGQNYMKKLVQLSDTFVLDGKINMVISGNPTQRKKLISRLDEMENNKEIIYGSFVCKESIISCYVRDRNAQHIHFVDGSDGGYTKAAVMLKQKIRN